MSEIVELLIDSLGKNKVLSGDDLKDRYNHIWTMDMPLHAKAFLLPDCTNDVSKIMKICHSLNQPVIVFGGLTNLVGSTETEGDEIIISTEKMNQIEEVDSRSRTITVQSGVILENVQRAAKESDLLFPLNFGAKGTAQMGGVISTNAGGLRVFRFGMTRNLVLGLEVVLPDGTVINSLKKIIKDNSAYDLKQLFIGSEGTLGIITKAVLKLVELPQSRTSSFVGINDFNKVISFLKYMDKGMAGTLSGFELIFGETYKKMTSTPALAKPPVPHGYNYYVLIEGLGSNQNEDQAKLHSLIENAYEANLILDAAIAESESDLTWFWTIREDVHVLVTQCTFDQHFDISLPIPLIGEYVSNCTIELQHINDVDQIFSFGHIADGNIHFIIGKKHKGQDLTNQINDIIYGGLQKIGGSVSAEHGIGLHKKAYLSLCRTPDEIKLMKTLKQSLDPSGILNPGKVIDV